MVSDGCAGNIKLPRVEEDLVLIEKLHGGVKLFMFVTGPIIVRSISCPSTNIVALNKTIFTRGWTAVLPFWRGVW